MPGLQLGTGSFNGSCMSDTKSRAPGESRTCKKKGGDQKRVLQFSNIKKSLLCISDWASPGALLYIAPTGKGTRENEVQPEIIQYGDSACCKGLNLKPLLWASSNQKMDLPKTFGLSGDQCFHLERRCIK